MRFPTRTRTITLWGNLLGSMLLTLLCLCPQTALALTNSATGTFNGIALDTTQATVTLNRDTGNAVDSISGEINPGSVLSATPTNFRLVIAPTFGSCSSGFDRLEMLVPALYSGVVATTVAVDGTALPLATCALPAPGSVCQQVAGTTLTLLFGDIIAGPTNQVTIDFNATSPANPGAGTFVVNVDLAASPTLPQPVLPGDADNDPTNNNDLSVVVSTAIDPASSTLIAEPQIVIANGTSTSNLIATLLGVDRSPVSGRNLTYTSDRPADLLTQPPASDSNGIAIGTVASNEPGIATITATDSDGTALLQRAQVYFTQGRVLDIDKSVNRDEVLIGETVTYTIAVRNRTERDVVLIHLADQLPPNFVYRTGSTRVNGVKVPDPPGASQLLFDLGTLPARVDSNGNGQADPGESGYLEVSYQLIVSAGATPGTTYSNRAWAYDVCDSCLISNETSAEVKVALDPLFDLGTIIGKVFEDRNGNGWQDADEAGIPGAMVVLDEGTYVLSDPHGRFHFPAVAPGERLVKINLLGLGNGALATDGELRVVSLTPGLLAKVNFGVNYRYEEMSIGSPPEYGIELASEGGARPIEIHGSVENHLLLLNGQQVMLPGNDIRMRLYSLDEVVRLDGGLLHEPISFVSLSRGDQPPENWQLTIYDDAGHTVQTLSGEGPLPQPLLWDGLLSNGALISGGAVYQYQLTSHYSDGTQMKSARRLFGVDRVSAISMSLTGSAFVVGSAELGPRAHQALSSAAETLRQHPQEVVVIEGHSDSLGGAAFNLRLSEQRAAAARDYLVKVEGLPADRFVTIGYGENQPLASNRLPEGRELNRRIEIKGEYLEVERARLLDQFHTLPQVVLNNTPVASTRDGRFHTQAEAPEGRINLAMNDPQGASLKTSIEVPRCAILQPRGVQVIPFNQQRGEFVTPDDLPVQTDAVLVRTLLRGQTDPGNRIWFGNQELTGDADGNFEAPLELVRGTNHVSLLIENPQGFTRLASLRITVADRDSRGGHIIYAEEVPSLSVRMPPSDKPLDSNVFVITGTTAPGNQIVINGEPTRVASDGHFAATLNLPQGTSPLQIEVFDARGHRGVIERQLTISNTRLFFLAFADGKINQLETSGNLANAGGKKQRDVMTEGRIALYLKGTVAGRYLLTAAFDTGRGEFDQLFDDLDANEYDRLLTNLDPDRLYPVYGDSSTLVHDTESQGKLYLALKSDELQLLLGNYSLDIGSDELARYRRTLYGGHAIYRSTDNTSYGDPYSEVELFAAEVRQQHVRDELAATGGSLYYLSQDHLIEGSEQVALLVRDQLTGQELARIPQEQGVDYTIKYAEGRLLFTLPVASVQTGQRLIDNQRLSGNQVVISVDYEAEVDAFENRGGGGHLRQQFGEHFALGATAVHDDTAAGRYQLWGVESELRLGKNTRLLSEYAESEGGDSGVLFSRDGGLSYTELPAAASDAGRAWKVAAELDIGSWFARPGFISADLYHKQLDPGYEASGLRQDQGTENSGALLSVHYTEHQTLQARYDREVREDQPPGAATTYENSTLQWHYHRQRWQLICEYLWQQSLDSNRQSLNHDQYAGMRLSGEPFSDLTTWIEHQQTLDGLENDKTGMGLDYRLFKHLSLLVSVSDGSQGRAAQGGLSYDSKAGSLYLKQTLGEDQSERTQATVLGGKTDRGLLGTTLYSEYRWQQTSTATKAVSLFGLERNWDLKPGLTLFAGGEFSEVANDDDSRRYTLTGGFSYRFKKLLRASSRNELRWETGATPSTQTVSINRGELKLGNDFTLLGLYRHSATEDQETESKLAGFDEISFGLAYRPVAHDAFNALARVTRLTDLRPADTRSTTHERQLESLACEWSLQLHRRVEWIEKQALRKLTEDEPGQDHYESLSWLSLHRLNLRAWQQLDLGIEYRTLEEDASNSQRRGWLTELSWRAQRHMRFGVGYNFTDFSDDERSFNDYSVRGWFLRAQGMY